jgi:O-antigen biosynthesis protein
MNWKYHNPKFEYEEIFEDSAEAWAGHKYFAYDLIANVKPSVVVELGTYYGTSFWSFSQAVKDQNLKTELNAVDTWKGEKHTGLYGEGVFEIVKQIKDKYYKDIKISLLRKTFDDVLLDFKNNSIDILHIDGLHTYEAVKHDFENWLPKLKSDGVILFHDIKVGENDFGVYKLWEELKKQYITVEFFQSYGLGVLFLNKTFGKEIKSSEKEWQMHYSYIYEKNKSKIITERNIKIQTTEQEVKQKIQEILIKNQEIQVKDLRIQSKTQDIENKNKIIKLKDQELSSLNQVIQDKNKELESKQKELDSTKIQLDSKINELSAIYACRGWRTIAFLRKVLEIITPKGSLRRKIAVFFFRFGKQLVKIIFKIKSKLSKSFFIVKNYFVKFVQEISLRKFNLLFKKAVFVYKRDGATIFIKKFFRYLINKKKYYQIDNIPSTRNIYPWIERDDITKILAEISNFKYKPRISVIVPVYNIDPKWLDKCIQSVINQYYDDWELCIHDDASTNKETVKCLKKWEKSDQRIKISFGKKNLHISGATNEAVKLSTGDFLALLDNDDELSLNALYENIKVLNMDSNTDLIYSDQDKIDEEDVHSNPFFKPDWSPEFFRGVMYVGHLLVVRKELATKIGLFDKRFDKVQDYEFALRLSEVTNNIFHIPKILYHWRTISSSGASNSEAKSGTNILHEKAVNEHLNRIGIKGLAKNEGTSHRLKIYPVAKADYPSVSIIIPTKDNGEILNVCLQSLFKITNYPTYEVILIDNNTKEERALEVMRRFNVRTIKYDCRFNYAEANNIGVSNANGEYIIFLNNDTKIIDGDWIKKMLFYAEQEGIGAVGPMLIYPDGTIQHAGVVLGFRGTADHIMRGYQHDIDGYYGSLCCAREVSAVTAACLMIKKSVFNEVGGFNQHYQTIYQDVDLCLKIRDKNYNIIYTPSTKLIHFESKSRGNDYDYLDRLLLLDLWENKIKKGDPYYNINFDLNKYSEGYTGYNI